MPASEDRAPHSNPLGSSRDIAEVVDLLAAGIKESRSPRAGPCASVGSFHGYLAGSPSGFHPVWPGKGNPARDKEIPGHVA
jgi:hypothetical protein